MANRRILARSPSLLKMRERGVEGVEREEPQMEKRQNSNNMKSEIFSRQRI